MILLMLLLLPLAAASGAYNFPGGSAPDAGRIRPTSGLEVGSASLEHRRELVEKWQDQRENSMVPLPMNARRMLDACMSSQTRAEEGKTPELDKLFHPAVLRARRTFATVPKGRHDVALLYSGDIRTFINPNVRDHTVTQIAQPLLQAGYHVHAFFALKRRLHYACTSPFMRTKFKGKDGCEQKINSTEGLIANPELSHRISEADVERVVDSIYPNNTVRWLHPSCCWGHRAGESTVHTHGSGLKIPEDCSFCKATGTCANTALFSQWYNAHKAHVLMEAHEIKRGGLFHYVLRLRPDAILQNPKASILLPSTARLLVERDNRICGHEDVSAMMLRWMSPFYFATYRNFEYCHTRQQPMVEEVCKLHTNYTNLDGIHHGVSFSRRRCTCDFQMHGNRFGLVYSISPACKSTFSFVLVRQMPELPVRSTRYSILSDVKVP